MPTSVFLRTCLQEFTSIPPRPADPCLAEVEDFSEMHHLLGDESGPECPPGLSSFQVCPYRFLLQPRGLRRADALCWL